MVLTSSELIKGLTLQDKALVKMPQRQYREPSDIILIFIMAIMTFIKPLKPPVMERRLLVVISLPEPMKGVQLLSPYATERGLLAQSLVSQTLLACQVVLLLPILGHEYPTLAQ